jgi:hypothetical protein
MFAIKAEVSDSRAKAFAFSKQKTMYGGRSIAKGDLIFVFASENEGGPGLVANMESLLRRRQQCFVTGFQLRSRTRITPILKIALSISACLTGCN